jgi:hypothetical protein
MDKLTTMFAFLAALSVATERITEAIKGFPLLSTWLVEEKADPQKEGARKASIQILAIGVGTALAYFSRDQLSVAIGLNYSGFWACLIYGAMASGGSGLWNSALDIAREFNKQRQLLTEDLKSKAAGRAAAAKA